MTKLLDRPPVEIHIANACRELRLAMAEDESFAIELMDNHQALTAILHRLRSHEVIRVADHATAEDLEQWT